MWQRVSARMQPADDPDEQPVIYRTPHTPLLSTAQSPIAPWLQTATKTADKLKQTSRFQTEKASEQLSCQVHSYLSPGACRFLVVGPLSVQALPYSEHTCKLCLCQAGRATDIWKKH